MASLKNELIGTWRLLSYIEVPINTGDSNFPLGKSPKGLLLFSPDSFMSVQISATEMKSFDSNDRLIASDELLASRVKNYISFSGRYSIDNSLAHVNYHIETCLFPNWEGTVQSRKLNFEADVLYQRSVDAITVGGDAVHAYMTWQRIAKEQGEELLKEDVVHFEL